MVLMMFQLLQLIQLPPRHPHQEKLLEQGHGFHFFLSFPSVGYLWTFATTNYYPVIEQFSFVARFSNDFDRLNGLFDDTINEICHQIHAYTTSNESFTCLQMLGQEDFKT